VNLIDVELQQSIANSGKLDFDAANAIKTLLGTQPSKKMKNIEDWTTEEFEGQNILFYKGKNYIPDDIALRRQIIRRYHDNRTAGHPGELETYNAVREHYWWPGLRRFITNYVQGCAQCQQYKINRNPTKPAFQPIKGATSTRPFANCSMDMITDLPPSHGYNSILSVVDHGLTKGIILIPTNKTVTHKQVGVLLIDNLYKRFGLPDSMISDRGPQFAAKAFQEMLRMLGVKSNLTTAYRPQSDGSTERFNQEIEAYLAIYCSDHPEDWPLAISTLEFTHNDRRHADRLRTSFELIMGTSPLATPTSFENTKFPHIDERLQQLAKDRQEALAAHELARARMAARIKSNYKPFKIGQKVWLATKNLKMNLPSKFKPKEEGPFTIIDKLGYLTYKLELPKTWKIHNNFHAVLLRPYIENEVYGPHFHRPPPEIVNEEEEYEVEKILSSRKRGNNYKYLIKWKGYPTSDNSWEPEENLANAAEKLNEYQRRKKIPLSFQHHDRHRERDPLHSRSDSEKRRHRSTNTRQRKANVPLPIPTRPKRHRAV